MLNLTKKIVLYTIQYMVIAFLIFMTLFIIYTCVGVEKERPTQVYSGDVRTWEDKQKGVTCWILTTNENKPITMTCLQTGGKK